MIRLLLLFVFFIVVAQAFWRTVDGVIEGLTGAGSPDGSSGPRNASGNSRVTRSGGAGRPEGIARSVQTVRDPVCGTFVVPERAVALGDGQARVYFCSAECRDKYHTFDARKARPA